MNNTIYEIWYDDYDGTMSIRESKFSLIERFLDKDKAYNRLKELNNGCNYGDTYFIKEEKINN